MQLLLPPTVASIVFAITLLAVANGLVLGPSSLPTTAEGYDYIGPGTCTNPAGDDFDYWSKAPVDFNVCKDACDAESTCAGFGIVMRSTGGICQVHSSDEPSGGGWDFETESGSMANASSVEYSANTNTVCFSKLMNTCTVSGDPHVSGFDGAQVSLVATAPDLAGPHFAQVYWLVKSAEVSIQGQFEVSETGQRLLTAIAVSGHFLQGHTLLLSSASSSVTWNGQNIPTTEAGEFSVPGLVTAKHDEAAMAAGIIVKLPWGTKLTVDRSPHCIKAEIFMRKTADQQQGLCGNFNGISIDDAVDLNALLSDMKVAKTDSLFSEAADA